MSEIFTRYGSNIANVWQEIFAPVTLAFSREVVHEKLWKSINICKSYSKKSVAPYFSGHGVCGYELPINMQNFTQKDLTEVKIFQKVLGGVLFWKTLYIWKTIQHVDYLAGSVEFSTSLQQLKDYVVSSFLGGKMKRSQPVLQRRVSLIQFCCNFTASIYPYLWRAVFVYQFPGYLRQLYRSEVQQNATTTTSWTSIAADTVCPRPSLTLTFDRLTLKLESHVRWGTFLPNLGMLGLWVLDLFAMFATNGQTDGRTKATLVAPFLRSGA